MDNNEIELVGAPCGFHGPYTFYKAFKYVKNGVARILSLSEFFFVKLWSDSDLVCIGELQLLWVDKNSEQMLASLRLYFLPEHTPEGRLDHGEDEVLAISEKVVLRVEDLLTWITSETEWNWGMSSTWSKSVPSPLPGAYKSEDDDEQDPLELEKDPLETNTDVNDPLADVKDPISEMKPFICPRRAAPALTDSLLDFSDVEKERSLLDDSWTKSVGVMVLSYPRYCRYRALMKRLEDVEDKWLKNSLVAALGGFTSPYRNTRVLFCKDTFDYPDLEGHELLCNHLAPKLKGRPRGKRKKRSSSPGGSESNESESSVSVTSTNARTRLTSTSSNGRNGLRCNTAISPRRSTRCTISVEEKDFLNKLNTFMKSHRTSIGRIPTLGLKENLYQLYTKVQKLGGYDLVTSNRMWKVVHETIGGGNHNSTSSATLTRKHYERLLLPYERKVRGEIHKLLPTVERRRLKSKSINGTNSESKDHPSTSGEQRATPLRTNQINSIIPPSLPNKLFTIPAERKSDGKTSSLRSIRVKPERMRDPSKQENKTITSSSSTGSTSTSTTPSTPTTPTTPTTPPVTSPAPLISSPIITPVTPSPRPLLLPPPAAPISIPTNASPKDPPSLAADKPAMENVSAPVQAMSDSKENIAAFTNQKPISDETDKTTVIDDDDDEPIEVPYKPKTPEIIELEDDSQPSPISITPVPEMKKRKLDILKQGGLEVTAVGSSLEITPIPRDTRPSLTSQQFNLPSEPPKQIGRVSITVTPSSSNKVVPPPAPVPTNIRPVINRHLPPPDSISQYRRTAPPHPPPPPPPPPQPQPQPPKQSFIPHSPVLRNPFNNSQTPPQVIQSRSIYSHSEKTVYGNPKDPFIPPQLNAHIPQHLVSSLQKPSGGEVLDLTVKSPQKPIVEIMRIPSVPSTTPHSTNKDSTPAKINNAKYSQPYNLPMIDGRVVPSNLEITLVGSSTKNSTKIPPPPPPSIPQKIQIPPTITQRLPNHKRSSSGKPISNKVGSTASTTRVIENGKNHLTISPSLPRNINKNGSSTSSNSANIVIPTPPQQPPPPNRTPKVDENRHKPPPTQQTPPSPNAFLPSAAAAASLFPGYLSQLSAASKHPFLPILDPLYYTALAQGLYSTNPLQMATAPPLFSQTPTAEQLQLYKELITHSSRLRMPFPPVLPEGSASLTSVGQMPKNSKN